MKKNTGTMYSLVFSLCCCASVLSAQTGSESLRWYQWNEGVVKAYNAKKFTLVYVFTALENQAQRMDRGAFADPKAQELLENYFIPIRFDARSEEIVQSGTERYTQAEWAGKLGIKAVPTILVYDEQLELIARGTYFETPEFIQFLKYIVGRYYKSYSFETFKHLKASD